MLFSEHTNLRALAFFPKQTENFDRDARVNNAGSLR